jgi:hypothetical protein
MRVSDLDDAERLARKIDVVLLSDSELRRRNRRIRKLQEELRRAVGNDNFGIYLRLEEEEIARGVHALDVMTVWAFGEGMRAGAQESEVEDVV